MGRLTPPEPLAGHHVLESFDCGHEFLNEWLRKHALASHRGNSAKTFVVCGQEEVAGYYSLAMGSVDHETAPVRIKKGLARYPIPVVVLAKLAVDLEYQGKRVGVGLVKDALLRSLTVSHHIGARAVFVNAKDEKVGSFYEHLGFVPLPGDSLKLILLMKDIDMVLKPVNMG